MKIRKLFALLMAAVMLLGMMPMAQAQVVNCDHNWVWRWPNGQPVNCQDWKWSEKYCTKCGVGDGGFEQCGPCVPGAKTWVRPQGANCQEFGVWEITCKYCGEWLEGREEPGPHKWSETIVEEPWCDVGGMKAMICSVCGEWQNNGTPLNPLGHNWGSWRWAHGYAPSCTEGAWQVRECKRCGRQEDRWVGAGSHKFGEWITTVEPTCTERGRHHHICSVCGYSEWEPIPTVDHIWGEWHVIEEPQVGIPGTERRSCTFGCGTHEDREIPPLEEAIALPGLQLTLTLDSTPANGEYFVVGEQVVFTASWSNLSPFEMFPFYVSIWPYEQPSRDSQDLPYSCSFDAEEPITSGMTGSHGMVTTVTEEDVARGGIYAMAYIWSSVHNGPEVEEVTTPFVTAPCGAGQVDLNGLTVIKSASAGDYSDPCKPGDEVIFTITVTNNTGVELLDVEITDPIKGGNEDAIVDIIPSMQPGESVTASFSYTVTEEDATVGVEGFENTAYASGHTAEGTQVSGTSNTIFVWCVVEHGLTFFKSIANVPANGEFFVPGETIVFEISMIDNTPYPLYNIMLTDPLCEDQYTYDAVNDMSYLYFGELYPEGNAMGESTSATVTVSYVVTEADAEAGSVTNTAEVTYQTWYGETRSDSASVTVKCGKAEDNDMGLSGALRVTKSVTSTPANGSFYVPGETVTFNVQVVNTGAPMDSLSVSDWMWERSYSFGTINTNEDVTYLVSYTVTELDAINGSVSNIACAEAAATDDDTVMEYSNIVTVPCGFPEGDDPFGVLTGLDISKEVESLPLNGSYYTEGETVAYKIIYTNSGELPLTDVQIYDAMGGMSEIATAETLNPGESRVCWFNHTVTAGDVSRGYISNTAVGQYELSGWVNTASSNTVTVDTNGKQDLWTVHPFWPGEDPEYDPGTGWLPDSDPDLEGDTPSFGAIDTDALHSGETYCVRTITGRDNVSVSYETGFCAVHSLVQSSALLMQQAAATPEMQVQAAAYATALWRSEVEKLYQELMAAADPAAQAVLMTEYIRFVTDVANYEAMLKVLHPDQPALAAGKVAKIWENKCIDLCYDTHAAADERKDSLLAVTPTAGAAAVSCTCEVTAQEAGRKAIVQRHCAMHGFPFSMTDALLRGNDTADAWTMVRQIWGVELTSAYNRLYAAMGENKPLAMAEQHALTQWMMAREASLIALYPENPEVVAQTMVKLIMDRVNDLCQVTK